MIRNLRRLNAVLVVILALVGLFASSASALDFRSESDHTIYAGTQVGTNTIQFTAGTIHCSTVTFAGTSTATTSSEITLEPFYSGCTATPFGGAIIHTNGCHLLLTSGGQLDIKCPAGESIKITAPFCTITVTPQEASGVTYTNTGSGSSRHLDAVMNVSGLAYSQTAGCTHGSNSFSNGHFTGSITIDGENTAKEPVGIWTEEPSPEVHSEESHTAVTGEQKVANKFTFGVLVGDVECEVATFDGTLAASTGTQITAKPAYSKCVGLKREATVHMNGCAYSLTFTGEGSDGALDIECPAEKSIEMTVDGFPGGCTLTVGAQTPGGVVDYKAEGSGSTRDLLLTWTIEGIKYKRDGCEVEGEGNNGTLVGTATLKGENTSGEQKGIWIE